MGGGRRAEGGAFLHPRSVDVESQDVLLSGRARREGRDVLALMRVHASEDQMNSYLQSCHVYI